MSKYRYGFRRQLPDFRDFAFEPTIDGNLPLPPSVDLRPNCPPVYDQGQLGSCTGNGVAGIHEFAQMKQSEAAFTPARLFIYYNERAMEGMVKQDAGANIRDGLKSIANQGVCPETMLPYDIAKFAKKPPKKCYTEALKHQALTYMAVTPTLDGLKACLASGFPFTFGISVYESFESAAVAKTGIVPMPTKKEKLLGGHCIVAVGYDDAKQTFVCRNSWGVGWGDKGYFYLPYAYIADANLASDFWAVELVK